jgi:hypothetical protein
VKIRPVDAELFCADRRTDMTKLTVGFRNSANAPNERKQNAGSLEVPTDRRGRCDGKKCIL